MQASLLRQTTLSGTMDNSQTTVPVTDPTQFPSVGGIYSYYSIIIWDGFYGNSLTALQNGAAEEMLVTSHDGATDPIAVVTRNYGGTGAVAFNNPNKTYYATLVWSAKQHDDLVKQSDLYRADYLSAFASPYNGAASGICHPVAQAAPGGSQTFPKDTIYAVPDWEVAGAVIRSMKVRRNATSTDGVRVGIYRTTLLNGNAYPGALLGQAVYTTPTATSPLISGGDFPITIPETGMFWYAIIVENNISMLPMTTPARLLLGYYHVSSTNSNPIWGLTYSQAYGALPDPFPTSSAALNAPTGAITAPWMTKNYQPLS